MDYSDDVFHTFLGLDSGSQWDSPKPPGFHPKYLKLCSEDESFTGLEQRGGKWLMAKF